MDRMEANIDRLQQDMETVKDDVAVLKDDMEYVKRDMGTLKGWGTEMVSRSHPEYYMGPLRLVRPRTVSNAEILNMAADALDDGRITDAELDQVGRADTYLTARHRSDRQEVWVVSQVSFSIYPNDVTRAIDEARILGKITGEAIIPAVAGERITDEAGALADANQVHFVRIRNGNRLME